MSNLVQQVIVGLVALGAAAFVVRKIVDAVRPASEAPTCDGCAMHESTDRPPTSR